MLPSANAGVTIKNDDEYDNRLVLEHIIHDIVQQSNQQIKQIKEKEIAAVIFFK